MERKRLSIAIPSSFVSDVPHLREKTSRIGLVGRASGIFRVSEIIVYVDEADSNQASNVDLISTILYYIETPQYLRRKIFSLRSELRYAGVLPPLRTPHHPLNRKAKRLRLGEYREGFTVSQTEKGTLVDIGVDQLAVIVGKRLAIDRRVTVKILEIGRVLYVELAARNEISDYWGYIVRAEGVPFMKIVKAEGFDLKIGTSRRGVTFSEVQEEIGERWKKADTILLVFGAPKCGIYEMAEQAGLQLEEEMDFVINTIPDQGTETVRTEEALMASLAILNMRFSF